MADLQDQIVIVLSGMGLIFLNIFIHKYGPLILERGVMELYFIPVFGTSVYSVQKLE